MPGPSIARRKLSPWSWLRKTPSPIVPTYSVCPTMSAPLFARRQDGPDQLLRHVGAAAPLLRAGLLAQANRHPVGLQVVDAGRALAEVLLEQRLLLGGQLAVEVGHQEVDDLPAGHATPPRN